MPLVIGTHGRAEKRAQLAGQACGKGRRRNCSVASMLIAAKPDDGATARAMFTVQYVRRFSQDKSVNTSSTADTDLHLAHRHLPTVESLPAPRALPPTRSAAGWPN